MSQLISSLREVKEIWDVWKQAIAQPIEYQETKRNHAWLARVARAWAACAYDGKGKGSKWFSSVCRVLSEYSDSAIFKGAMSRYLESFLRHRKFPFN